MPMLSAVTLRDLITAHAAQDTLEMEHHAEVYTSFVYYYKKKLTKSLMPVWIFMLQIFGRDRDLHSSTFGCVTINIMGNINSLFSNFFEKITVRILDALFRFLGFRKSLLRALTSSFITGFKTLTPSWHWDVLNRHCIIAILYSASDVKFYFCAKIKE